MDVLDGQAVRLERGDYDRVAVDGGDPFELIARVAAARPPLVHVVALGAARDGGAPVELARRAVAAAAPVAVQLGGGVRSVADAQALVDAGVARVMIGTAAFGPIPLEEFVARARRTARRRRRRRRRRRPHGRLARLVAADDRRGARPLHRRRRDADPLHRDRRATARWPAPISS